VTAAATASRAPRPDALSLAGARLYELDALRIRAALAVVVHHHTFSGPAGGHTQVAFPAAAVRTRVAARAHLGRRAGGGGDVS
jgi:peptidoglycan/LPS O-acetylase OafA/YrhL